MGLVSIYLYQNDPDVYTSSLPTIAIDTGQNADIQRVDRVDNQTQLFVPAGRQAFGNNFSGFSKDQSETEGRRHGDVSV